jgi:hypothetical protein
MNPIRIRHSLAGLMAAIALGAMATVGSSAPSMAQVAGAQFGAADHSLVENAAYLGRRGVVGRGYRGAYVGRGGYGYRGYGRGAGVGAAVAGALIGGALAAPYYRQPYGYYQQPYGYYQQPYGYYQQPYGYDGY